MLHLNKESLKLCWLHMILITMFTINVKGDMMPIIHWKPFHDLENFFDQMHQGPDLAIDVTENGKEVILKMNIPGIEPDNVNIEIEDDYHVRINGTREEESEVEDQHYYRKEIRRGSFERIVELPAAINKDDVMAHSEKGVLTVIFQKKEKISMTKKKINILKK